MNILVTGAAGFIGCRQPAPRTLRIMSATLAGSLLLQGLRPRTPVGSAETGGDAS